MFDDVEPFDHKIIPQIMNPVNAILSKAGVSALPIGSGATPTPGKISGDLDVIADEAALGKHFGLEKAADIRKALRALFDQSGLETGQSGVSVHVRVPVGSNAHQVDIMVVPNAANAAKFHTHTIPQGSKWKGVNKQIAMAVLAKKKNMLWSPYQGLFSRNDAGKKGDLLTDNIDKVAKLLLGKQASAKDLGSVEAILAAMPTDQANAFLTQLRDDPSWVEKA